MKYHILKALKNGYRVRLNTWHPDSYWYMDDFDGYMRYSGITKEKQPLFTPDKVMEYIVCENWDIIQPV